MEAIVARVLLLGGCALLLSGCATPFPSGSGADEADPVQDSLQVIKRVPESGR